MGVVIRAFKPYKFICEDLESYPLLNPHKGWLKPLYCLGGFEPIQHLTQFEWGWWLCEQIGESEVYCSYGTWGVFRNLLRMISDSEDSFAEIIHFADNEGCFDWLICQELIKDFEEYYDKAKQQLEYIDTGFYWDLYQDTMQVLRDCIDCKGVVIYD